MRRSGFIACAFVAALAACPRPGPELVYAPVAPSEDEFPLRGLPPNGDLEPVRYLQKYQVYWWNCVMLRANDLDARCPSGCSGTAAASYGCSDGEQDASSQIDELLERYPRQEVQKYLQSYVAEHAHIYFDGEPFPFIVDLPAE